MSGRLSTADRTLARAVKAARIYRARTDPAEFCAYVLRHEKTNEPITLAPMHEEWHRLMSEHSRLLIWSHVEAGKTNQISVGRTLFKLGRNPSRRILIGSNSQGAAKKIISLIARYIEKSKELHEVFPHLKPGAPWTQTALTVERPTFSKDPSVQALGIGGDVIGSRVDDLVLDDLLDYENTRTREMRIALRDWALQSLFGRLTDKADVIGVGNAFYKDDVYHYLAEELGYVWRKYPVADEHGTIAAPLQWTPERIAKMVDDLGGPGSAEAMRQLFCIDRSDEASRCKEEWIVKCLERGVGIPVLDGVTEQELADSGGTAHTGVDLGVKKHRRAAKTVVFSILSYPPEDGERFPDRQVLNVKSGRWGAREIVQNVLGATEAFHSTAHVEDNGAQDFLLQIAHGEVGDVGDAGAALTVLPFHTGGNKTHPVIGVESVFAELARGQWIIPAVENATTGKLMGATPEIREWLQEMLDYAPEAHTGDHFMASWFSKEGARLQVHRGRTVGVKIIGADVTDSDERARGEHPDAVHRPELQGWEALLKRGRR